MPARPRPRSRRRAAVPRPLRTALAALLMVVATGGCALLPIRQPIDEARARAVLADAVAVVQAGRTASLCDLSPADGTTCAETLESLDVLAPDAPPEVRCAVPVGDEGPMRGGVVLVLEGVDAQGEAYRTDFAVYDRGRAVVALDAVWWSGLSIESYGADEVAWRFGGDSRVCEEGLPTGPPPGAGG